MNLKTTFLLLFLTIAGAAGWYGYQSNWFGYGPKKTAADGQDALTVLEEGLKGKEITHLEIRRGDRSIVLDHGASGWTLPGKWPTRESEVDDLVRTLSHLQTRFQPIPLGENSDLSKYGLDQPIVVKFSTGAQGEAHQLAFGEKAEEHHRFPPITYVRIDDKPEVLRLAPGLVGMLKRPLDVPDYFQRRWLFSRKRDREEDDKKSDRLDADALAVTAPTGNYSLSHTGSDWDQWELSQPVKDRVDPDKLKTLLTALPDLWAEKFVEKSGSSAGRAEAAAILIAAQLDGMPALAYAALPFWRDMQYGLLPPVQTISVTRGKNETATLLIGKQAEVKRSMPKPPPPDPLGGQPPPPEPREEEFRYAKLKDNDQIFTIKTDKLKDLFVAANTLRDPRLARFQTKDVRKVKITHADQDIDFVKEKERWKLANGKDAEASKLEEILDKLSSLSVAAADLIDHADAKTYGLQPPAGTVKIAVEESKGEGDKKTTKTKSFTFTLGKKGDDKKTYVRVDNWERVNGVEEGLLKLVERPALAYRGRRIFDFTSSDLAKIDVQQDKDKFRLEQAKEKWHLAAPVDVDADNSKVNQLAGDLGRLEAVEYVKDAPSKDDLDKTFGLAKPALSVNLSFSKADSKPQTLLVGKQRGDKGEYFAKLEAEPAVFVIKKDIHDDLAKNSLAYRPLELWKFQADEIAELRNKKGSDEYRLKRETGDWKVIEPFNAPAVSTLVQPMVDDLAALKGERFEAHAAKDLVPFGLDKPYLQVAFDAEVKETKPETDKDKKPEAKPKVEKKSKTLLIGKPTAADAKTRFAKLADSDAVFVVAEKVVAALDHSALDLLDKNLLTLKPDDVSKIQTETGGTTVTLQKTGDAWRGEAGAVKFPADADAVAALLGVWSNLKAERFAAYGPKVDWAAYGLDKPDAVIAVTSKPNHKLVVGKPVSGDKGERYARLEDGPGAFVLAPAATAELTHGYLDYVDRTLLKLDPTKVTGLYRKKGAEAVELVKQDDAWQMLKPEALRGDDKTVQGLVDQLASLKARSIAAYPAKDFQKYGLDAPAAEITVRLAGAKGKAEHHTLRVGEVADKSNVSAGDRYVRVDNADVVGVLPGALVRKLVAAPPLQFRDHNLGVKFADADRVILERGPRRATFAKVDGTWKLVSPLESEAEQTDLEDFVNDVARLRADEIVDNRPAEPVYGLARPEARWRFQSGDKEVLNLLVGGKEKDGPRRYAKLAANDLVFLLDPKLTAKAVGEYRSRTLWPSLDSAQVESLNYKYAKNPFVLEKVNNTWQAAGKPEAKIKSESVTETLDALARLKADRFVADKDADMKLYGLEPPDLVLEIKLPTVTRVLQIGRQEGDSKRYYARLGDPARTDVFVISETDAGRILRDLAAFATAPAKAGTKN